MLHTLSTSPWHADLHTLCRMLKAGDEVVMLSDGVLAALNGNPFLELLADAPISLYVLKEDLDARGLSGQISSAVVRVDYTDFVRLAVKHPGQLAW
ncbi:sulfurtransferase complex subunit TusB [Yokenella regensburgei]|uniref:Protein TusB n=1 Tax=Yokenella regensburgei TaxID=158877 RepID=A0AB38FZS7_9ENTR|nr:sulfurtransferase complex subunit TusB [Yokenella regensburgei]KAF1369448.1 tRNA 2-thiouridine synthesizing protein B [Yokenella regensburgei]MDQ4430119.1 sulfurtransferase complex subunit TusB [Yokenella regensburgei]QIU90741.1 sulfurtransferase complex subunit TusB [Yokenella regensburgei]RKR53212.1 tRNA 2-thiouridine synthesizing protein B [Yokenella regensburgei]SQA64484.1 tRNA 2-thiouridine synthesizing protein B [Yokenella regensburgei]